jgi:hypothetical protein
LVYLLEILLAHHLDLRVRLLVRLDLTFGLI